MPSTNYKNYGLNLSTNQMEKIARAAKKNEGVSIRLSKTNLHGSHQVPLTDMQITKIQKGTGHIISLSASQLESVRKLIVKHGGILPFLPLIFGAIGAVSAAAGGAKAIHSVVTERAQTAETERHNKALEEIERNKYLSKVGEIDGKGLYMVRHPVGDGLYLKRSRNGGTTIKKGL